MTNNFVIIEQAALELLPKSLHNHKSARAVELRSEILPKEQILDDNFHHEALAHLDDKEKRGRPDVVHFALLDITSTPLYIENKVSVAIHTLTGDTIRLKEGVRVPRTLPRFNGLISKILSDEMGDDEEKLFSFKRSQSFTKLLEEIGPTEVVCLTKMGRQVDLRDFVALDSGHVSERNVWVVGGFAFGHFTDEVIESSEQVVSISSHSLPAHVVTARLCYELERVVSKA